MFPCVSSSLFGSTQQSSVYMTMTSPSHQWPGCGQDQDPDVLLEFDWVLLFSHIYIEWGYFNLYSFFLYFYGCRVHWKYRPVFCIATPLTWCYLANQILDATTASIQNKLKKTHLVHYRDEFCNSTLFPFLECTFSPQTSLPSYILSAGMDFNINTGASCVACFQFYKV